MESVILNKTPKRTSKIFGINEIKIEDFKMPKITAFDNVKIKSTIEVIESKKEIGLKYGVGKELEEQLNKANKNLYIQIKEEVTEPIIIEFELTDKQNVLVDNITIEAKENSKADVIIKYTSLGKMQGYHNGLCNVVLEKNSNIKVAILNLLNEDTQNYYSMNNKLDEAANLDYVIVDFGGKRTITNYYSNLSGDNSVNKLSSIYIGKNEQLLDLNYIAEAYGKNTNIDIEVYGALKDCSKKNFKGTIDFKKGAKKAIGNENEYCMLLSKTAKSKALPMLLCSEDDVQGNHSNSAGKIDENKLYYIMSRGISEADAKKLIVKAQFSGGVNKIDDEGIKQEVLDEIDNRLS